jgi:hypothetical protein
MTVFIPLAALYCKLEDKHNLNISPNTDFSAFYKSLKIKSKRLLNVLKKEDKVEESNTPEIYIKKPRNYSISEDSIRKKTKKSNKKTKKYLREEYIVLYTKHLDFDNQARDCFTSLDDRLK